MSCTGTIGAADDSVSPAQSPGPTIPGSAAVDLSATPHLVRLTSTQWLNAARDAFGGSEALSAGLKPLPEGGGHFDTLSSKFVIGEAEFSAMAAAADQLSARVLANSTLLAQLTMGAQGKAAANALIRKVGRRIHRATLTADDVQDYESVYVASLPTVDPGGDAHRFALGQVISSMLQSPNFV